MLFSTYHQQKKKLPYRQLPCFLIIIYILFFPVFHYFFFWIVSCNEKPTSLYVFTDPPSLLSILISSIATHISILSFPSGYFSLELVVTLITSAARLFKLLNPSFACVTYCNLILSCEYFMYSITSFRILFILCTNKCRLWNTSQFCYLFVWIVLQ